MNKQECRCLEEPDSTSTVWWAGSTEDLATTTLQAPALTSAPPCPGKFPTSPGSLQLQSLFNLHFFKGKARLKSITEASQPQPHYFLAFMAVAQELGCPEHGEEWQESLQAPLPLLGAEHWDRSTASPSQRTPWGICCCLDPPQRRSSQGSGDHIPPKIPSEFLVSRDIHPPPPQTPILPKEAVKTASREEEKNIFSQSWQIHYALKYFLITPLSQPHQWRTVWMVCLQREQLGSERPLRSILYCRQTHYVHPLINVINPVCKSSLG